MLRCRKYAGLRFDFDFDLMPSVAARFAKRKRKLAEAWNSDKGQERNRVAACTCFP